MLTLFQILPQDDSSKLEMTSVFSMPGKILTAFHDSSVPLPLGKPPSSPGGGRDLCVLLQPVPDHTPTLGCGQLDETQHARCPPGPLAEKTEVKGRTAQRVLLAM